MRHIRFLLVNQPRRLGVRVGIACGALGKYSLATDPPDFPRIWREMRREVRDYLEYAGRPPLCRSGRPDWIDTHFRQKQAVFLRRLVATGWSADADRLSHLGYGGKPSDPESYRKLLDNTNSTLAERMGVGWETDFERRGGIPGRALRRPPPSPAKTGQNGKL